jgi:hypothetical protein
VFEADRSIGRISLANLLAAEPARSPDPRLTVADLAHEVAAAKRHFVDPSLAVAALRATPERLLQDLNLFGFLFESLAIRDLRVYAQSTDAQVLHYHDSDGLEVDAIVQAAGGPWAAFEIKLRPGQVDAAAKSLLKFAKRIDTEKCGQPAALGVIVGTGYGYVRDDGIQVIPIGAMGP